MNKQTFLEFSKAIPDALLLLDLEGRVVASSLGDGYLWEGDIVGQSLGEIVATPGDAVERYLRLCSKNSQPVVGGLSFRAISTGEEAPCRIEGVGIRTSSSGIPDRVMLRIVPRDRTRVSKFAELSRRLQEKNRETAYRWREFGELKRHETELRALIDATQDAVVFIDGSAQIIRSNQAAQTLFGYSWEEMKGQPVTMLMPEKRPRSTANT